MFKSAEEREVEKREREAEEARVAVGAYLFRNTDPVPSAAATSSP
jgi:hypothetical protein